MCKVPNYMIWNGLYTPDDKPKLTFIGHHEYNRMIDLHGLPFIQVPCGKCLECRIQYARAWADRCVLHAKQYKDNYFVTLTYDDEHLPAKNSLCPEHMTNFIKRLRKRFPDNKISYLYAGEYGDVSKRPHYHILLFNCPLNDLTYVFQKMENGKLVNHLRPKTKSDLKFSRTIYDEWYEIVDGHKEHLGMISVGAFNYDTASYVAQYVTKKCNQDNDIYKQLGIVPEFIRMSRRPGIAANYFDEHDNLHDIGHVIVPSDGEAHISAVPRYYDKLFIKKYGDDVFDPIRIRRNKKKIQRLDTYKHGSMTYDHDAQMRDYKLNKLKSMRDAI